MSILQSPTSNFNAVRDGRSAPDFYFDLDLSVLFDTVINVAGNSLYADANPSDGVCTIYFQDTASDRSPTPFYVSPGFIARIPFTQIRVQNTRVQPGKKLRIVYGTDTDFQPGSVSQLSISGQIGLSGPGQAAVDAGQAFRLGTALPFAKPAASYYYACIINATGKAMYLDATGFMAPNTAAVDLSFISCDAVAPNFSNIGVNNLTDTFINGVNLYGNTNGVVPVNMKIGHSFDEGASAINRRIEFSSPVAVLPGRMVGWWVDWAGVFANCNVHFEGRIV